MRRLIILSLASTVLSHSSFHKRHSSIKARIIEERAVEALEFDAAAIFPPPLLEKRGLVGDLLGGVGSILNPVVTALAPSPTTTTTTAPAPNTTPTTDAGTSSNAQADPPAQQSTQVANSPNTPAAPGASPTPSAGAGNTNPSNGNTSAGGPAGGIASSGITGVIGVTNNDLHATPTPQVVTDHNGNLLTITGPVTRTWLTTFPNGVVSTVTEVLTPTVEVPGEAPISMAPGKIAAIVGTIVTVFLVTFTAALVFLMMRKRQKRRNALLDSRPNSIASFGSASDEFNGEPRVSHTVVDLASTASFVTAPAYFDGTQMEFPLPPVPAAESRPGSSLSDATFDFSQYRKSRGSIIEDRNRFRKIGQYPDADSYTPFVLPPSEVSHSEEVSGGTPRASTIIDHDRSLGTSSSGSYLTSNNPALPTTGENPFVDPVTVPQAIHTRTDSGNLLANSAARRSTLWRTPTFGPDSKILSTRRLSRVPSTSRSTMASVVSTEYITARDRDDTDSNGHLSRHPSTSSDHYSYHSAFDVYIRSGSPHAPASENPFVDQTLPAVPTNISPSRVTYPALRPNTATSSGGTSVVSSVGNGSSELGGARTPDPRDLFYSDRSQPSSRRISRESRVASDGASTVQTRVVYPALRDSTTPSNSS